MAQVVATRSSATNSPHLSSTSQTASPRSQRNSLPGSDPVKKEGALGNDAKSEPSIPTINHSPPEEETTTGNKDAPAPPPNAPLAPPPKPAQNGDDVFSGTGPKGNLSHEPNPFEAQFGNPIDTPGKTQLPGVTSLTSPAPLLPANTPGWGASLRSGPLSPAMLPGPTSSNDYFNTEHHFGGSFPTPNESSLRTGLTPGGGGSMFPQSSPNSQALYNSLQSDGATPGTLDFHRTAMTARAQNQGNSYLGPNAVTSQPPPQPNPNIQPDLDSKSYNPNGQTAHRDNQDPFGSHQTNDAANGLFMLAQAGGQQRNAASYPMPQQPQQAYQQVAQQNPRGKGSIGSNISGSTDGAEHYSEEDGKTQRSTRGKKGWGGKGAANGKRKTEDTPAKGPAHKKARSGNGMTMSEEPEDDEEGSMDGDEKGPDGKKMTDEEKRKNFLERNRVAALKCRQRKKQWLANLQQKVEIFSTENDALAATVTQLREEIVGLKTLLLSHKDCPVSQAQGISGMAMQQIAGDAPHYANPYGMMGQGGPMAQQGQMAQGQMQRG